MGYFAKNRVLPSAGTSVVIPSGGSAVRPSAPVFGSFRYNTDLGQMEYFNGSSFVQLSSDAAATLVVDSFTGDGSTVTFSLSLSVSDTAQVIVFVGNIYQQPSVYSITGGGNDITFSEAPPDDSPINVIHNLGA